MSLELFDGWFKKKEVKPEQKETVTPQPVENKVPEKDKDKSLSPYHNDYILKAIDYLNKNFGLLGYDINSALTHDISYDGKGNIKKLQSANAKAQAALEKSEPRKTMCVAAVLEAMLYSMKIYASETGDKSVFDYLPLRSWQGLGINDIRGHIWVNAKYNSYGTADALRNFGMGELKKFENLIAGDFIGLNRTTGTGHAVIFISYLDKKGNESLVHHSDVAGFKYWSAQGGRAIGNGGFDYRYAFFSNQVAPTLPVGKKRDVGVIYSANPKIFNCGSMWAPHRWAKPQIVASMLQMNPHLAEDTELNTKLFDFRTIDDEIEYTDIA